MVEGAAFHFSKRFEVSAASKTSVALLGDCEAFGLAAADEPMSHDPTCDGL